MKDPLSHLDEVPLTSYWRIRDHIIVFWEIDTEALSPLIPEPLELVEVRPCISLFGVECVLYHKGHFKEEYPEFVELVLAAAVHPDLSLKMPVSRFSMYSISVYTDSPEFLAQEGDIFSLSEVIPGLRMSFISGGGVDVYDKDTPILSYRSTHPSPEFKSNTFWGQYYTDTKNQGLQRGAWRWEGEMFEHMKPGNWGRFFAHPFYKGLDLSRVRGCYRQMMAKPESHCRGHFYHVDKKL
jgi:hypothetical protein